jgi:son of sevenless-like protein
LKYKNYNGLLELVGGLNNPSVMRLNQTWKTLNKKYIDLLEKLKLIVSPEHNWKNYRPLMQNEAPPLVPYIGLFLSDLTFINDGNPTKVDGLINWKKMRKLSAILGQIQRAQQSQYSNIQPDPDSQQFLRQELFILDDKELFNRSRVLEPPETTQSKK